MSVSTFEQPNYASDSGTEYPAHIDAAVAVMKRAGAAFAAHEADPPDMTVVVDAGPVFAGGSLTEKAQQTTAAFTAPSGDPRIDRVVMDASTGTVSVEQGAEAADPDPPSIPQGKLPVAQVALTVGMTEITNADLTDERAAASAATAIAQGTHTITVPAVAMYPAVTDGAAEIEEESTTNAVNTRPLAFDPATEEYAWLAFIAPKSADETAGFTVRNLKWGEDGSPTSHGVVWGFAMLARGNGETLDTALGTEVTVADTGGAAGTVYTADESGTITPGGTWAAGDLLLLRVARKVGNGSDTLDTDALLYGLELTLTINAGSDA